MNLFNNLLTLIAIPFGLIYVGAALLLLLGVLYVLATHDIKLNSKAIIAFILVFLLAIATALLAHD
jgi:hypothetical protein